jgi:hypothetical protein
LYLKLFIIFAVALVHTYRLARPVRSGAFFIPP